MIWFPTEPSISSRNAGPNPNAVDTGSKASPINVVVLALVPVGVAPCKLPPFAPQPVITPVVIVISPIPNNDLIRIFVTSEK